MADGKLGDITATGGNKALNIANFVLDGCGLTHAGADLQGLGNLGNGAGSLYASFSGLVTLEHLLNARLAITQSRRLPKIDANQINKENRKTDPRTNKRVKVDKLTISEAAPTYVTEEKLKRVSKFDDVLDGCRRDVNMRTRRDLDKFDD